METWRIYRKINGRCIGTSENLVKEYKGSQSAKNFLKKHGTTNYFREKGYYYKGRDGEMHYQRLSVYLNY